MPQQAERTRAQHRRHDVLPGTQQSDRSSRARPFDSERPRNPSPGAGATQEMHAGSSRMSCANPIDPAVLADYWLAELPAAEESALEEHLFACGDCASSLQSLVDLIAGIRALARQ